MLMLQAEENESSLKKEALHGKIKQGIYAGL